ncbi:MAG: hypothetical protein Q8N00_01560 [Nitrospirota bacterium]|nr:hypothetical protein [Nitrospirota bacterium]MDP3598517.1 hypothetical protein [Nitrospirota bacterium]
MLRRSNGIPDVLTVGRFIEKPDAQMAQTLGAGLLLNTMIIMAKVKTRWSLGVA